MSALTGTRVVLVGEATIKRASFPLAAGAKAFEGGLACIDTGAYGALKQGAVSTTLIPVGWWMANLDNTAGGSSVPIGVELFKEHFLSYWDSVASGGTVTAANLFQPLYIASDHELTTTSTGASIAGRLWKFGAAGYPSALGIEMPPI